LILRQGWRVLPLSPRAPMGGGSSSAHLAARLRPALGTSGPADVGAWRGGRWQLWVSISLFSPLSPLRVTSHPVSPQPAMGWEGGDTQESHPIRLWGWGRSSAWGVSGQPLGRSEPSQAWRSAFLLAVPSCEGGRTIWSPLRQPNKPGNAGQELQIPLTAVGHGAEAATRA